MSIPRIVLRFATQTITASARLSTVVWGSVLGFVALLLWDMTTLDLSMAALFGNHHGFARHNDWLWSTLLHDGALPVVWALEVALLVSIALPFGVLRALPRARRLQLAVTPLVASVFVSVLKLHSTTSCPWDLQQFGGVAVYVSHWTRGVADGGGGGCFPAGHASAGFAFLGGFFAFRSTQPALAKRLLVAVMAFGLLLGLAQQIRGAHYMSHTLWTAWLCWMCAVLVDASIAFFACWTRRRLARRLTRSTRAATGWP